MVFAGFGDIRHHIRNVQWQRHGHFHCEGEDMFLEFGWAKLSGEEVGELFERCDRWPVEECPPGNNFVIGER